MVELHVWLLKSGLFVELNYDCFQSGFAKGFKFSILAIVGLAKISEMSSDSSNYVAKSIISDSKLT